MLSNYVSETKTLLRQQISKEHDVEEKLLDLYTLLVLTLGEECTLENVHDAWAVYTSNERPEHSSLIPFQDLKEEIQEYDRPFQEAIISTAELLKLS